MMQKLYVYDWLWGRYEKRQCNSTEWRTVFTVQAITLDSRFSNAAVKPKTHPIFETRKRFPTTVCYGTRLRPILNSELIWLLTNWNNCRQHWICLFLFRFTWEVCSEVGSQPEITTTSRWNLCRSRTEETAPTEANIRQELSVILNALWYDCWPNLSKGLITVPRGRTVSVPVWNELVKGFVSTPLSKRARSNIAFMHFNQLLYKPATNDIKDGILTLRSQS